MTLSELSELPNLRWVEFTDAVVNLSDVSFPSVEGVMVTGPGTSGEMLLSFPNVRSLLIDNARVALSSLMELPQLERITFIEIEPPATEQLARFRQLRYLAFVRVPDAKQFAARLAKVRPDVEIRVDGRLVSAGRDDAAD